MNGHLFIDTNILIYALDPNEPEKRQVAADLLRQAIRIRSLILSPQSLTETYRVLTERRKLMPIAHARTFIKGLAPWCTARLDSSTVERAWQIEDATGYGWWDSLMVAAALQASCRLFVSEDLQDGVDVLGMRIVNPFTPSFAQALARA